MLVGCRMPCHRADAMIRLFASSGRMRAPIVALELGRGETVGELSVLNPESKRECSVTVVRESELVRISAAAFDRMTRAHPPLMHLFTNRLASRYQQVSPVASVVVTTVVSTTDCVVPPHLWRRRCTNNCPATASCSVGPVHRRPTW